MSNDNKNEIREYLLGRITEAGMLENIEERLFSDDAFCSQVEIVEEELVQDFVFGKLNRDDRGDFEKKIAGNSELKFKIEMAEALKEKARETTVPAGTPGFLAAVRAFFSQPIYAGGFAVLLIAILVLGFFLLNRRGDTRIAELNNIYQKHRSVEPRISDFDYAPLTATRGAGDEADKQRLHLLEIKLGDALQNNPSAKNHHDLGVFNLTQFHFAEAIDELKKAVELDGQNARYYNDLGSAYFEMSQNGDDKNSFEYLTPANENFAKAVELDPSLLEALFNRSLTLQKLPLMRQQAKDSWNLYLQKDPSSKWAEEARKNLAQIESQPTGRKPKEEVLNEFLAAYHEDKQRAWKIHTDTKGMFTDTTPAPQLIRRYLEARQRHDAAQAGEAIEALTFIGKLEKEKTADFFFADLADFYKKIDDSQIAGLLEAKNALTEGRNLGNQEAVESFEKSRDMFIKLNDTCDAELAEYLAATWLADAGRINEGIARIDSSIEKAGKLKHKVFIPALYYYKNTSQWRENQFSASLENSRKSLEEAEKMEDRYNILQNTENIVGTYCDFNETKVSLEHIEKFSSEEKSYYIEPNLTCRALITFSKLAAKLGLYSTAVDFAQESLERSKQNASSDIINGSLRELTKSLAKKNQLDKALAAADESNLIALGRKQSSDNDQTIAYTFLTRADLKYQMQNCAAALPDYESALEYYGRAPEMTFNLYNVHKGKLLCLQALGKQTEFENELDTVLRLSEINRANIREDDSSRAFFDNEQTVYDAAIENALEQNNSRKAFDLLETSKARSLLNFVKSDKPIVELEKEFSSVTQPLFLPDIQARMPENVQVIQYSVLREKLAIWSFTKNSFDHTEKQISLIDLKQKISAYTASVLNKENARAAGKELYDLLLPLKLEPGKIVCLIPDKFLHGVPFSSLVSPQDKYLIEESAIFYSPSASIMVLASENAKQKESVPAGDEHLLGIGNPKFDRKKNPRLADLPDAKTEVESIGKNYPGAKEFFGDQATKGSFLNNLEDAEVVHFAGHFITNPERPDYSKLLFAGDSLISAELAEKHLPKTRLVVLSACQTGFEGYTSSEGAIGIARTFLALGSPLVLASGWPVDSEATKDMMIAFHRNRKEKGMNSAESLRQAQLELLQKENTGAPYYWSAFNLTGGFANY